MKQENIVTPQGVLVYPHLNKADTKFDKNGVFKSGLRLEKDSSENLIKQIDEAIELNAANETEKRKKSVKVAPPPYSEDEEGNIVFNFKLKASGVRANGVQWSQKPVLYDSKGNVFDPKDKIVWGGTTAKIAFQIAPYHVGSIGAGVSLRLKAVQILNLVTGGNDSTSFGFKEESGFVAETEEVSEEEKATSDF